MRILYYDCFAGISGDMNLAAMLELGVDPAHLDHELSKLGLEEAFALHRKQAAKCGIHGTRVDVEQLHIHHSHAEGHTHAHADDAHEHHHRGFTEISRMIEESTLADGVKKTSIAIFRRIGVAEAHVHDCSLDDIHFHEVGAIDSIVDVVGAAICYHALSPDRVLCSTIELGGGFVTCAHGKIPIPAPATVEILKGIPTRRGTVEVETATPTGAAILAELVDEFTDTPTFAIDQTAYGIGHRDMDIPNVLRVHLASLARKDVDAASGLPATVPAFLLECSVDDMTGELLGAVMDRLLEAGASDVNFLPITMKKCRPGTMISVLATPEREATLRRLLLEETTTLGVKRIAVDKTELARRTRVLATPNGEVRVKEALLGGKVIKAKPEFEDCQRIAHATGQSLKDVYRKIAKEL